MVKHVVMWKMKDFAEGNDMGTNIDIAVERIDEVAKQFPAMKSITHHKCLFQGNQYWDFIEIMEFDSVESLKDWAEFPPHKELHDWVEKIRIERAVVDYEI